MSAFYSLKNRAGDITGPAARVNRGFLPSQVFLSGGRLKRLRILWGLCCHVKPLSLPRKIKEIPPARNNLFRIAGPARTQVRTPQPLRAHWRYCLESPERGLLTRSQGKPIELQVMAARPSRRFAVSAWLPSFFNTSHAGPGNLCSLTSTSSSASRNQSTSVSLIFKGGSILMMGMA